MKKIVFLLIILTNLCLHAQFVDFREKNVSKNNFLGLDIHMCATSRHGSFDSYQCGNKSVSDMLNVNFLSPDLLGQQFYIYNNFMYWMTGHDGVGKWSGSETKTKKKEAKARANPDKHFSGSGVFMIVLGTSSYLQQIVSPEKVCPDGQTLLAAQLKYNDGSSLSTWSQDSICLARNDKFEILVNHKKDDTVPPKNAAQKKVQVDNADLEGIDWMKDDGPSGNYALAKSSPRTIRLIHKGSGVIVENKKGIQNIVSENKAVKMIKKKKNKIIETD